MALIRDVASARWGDHIAGPKLASLRRDEERSWRTSGRPVYIVPALTWDQQRPVRGTLALSSWPLETRLLAPSSQTVDGLHHVERLVGELVTHPDAGWADDVRQLVRRLSARIGIDPDRKSVV